MEISNHVRTYSYLFGIFKNQQADPFCRSCSAFNNSLLTIKDSLGKFDGQYSADTARLSKEFSALFSDVKKGIQAIKQPESHGGQKKAGNCKMPEGICFIKSSLTILQKI
jgi:hypothetical protein